MDIFEEESDIWFTPAAGDITIMELRANGDMESEERGRYRYVVFDEEPNTRAYYNHRTRGLHIRPGIFRRESAKFVNLILYELGPAPGFRNHHDYCLPKMMDGSAWTQVRGKSLCEHSQSSSA